MTDGELLARLRAGEDGAYTELVARYGHRLHRLAWVITRDFHLAEDALQDAMISFHRSLWSFRGETSLYGWLARITVSRAHNRARGHRAGASLADREGAGGYEQLVERERWWLVRQALLSLGKGERELAFLYYYEDLPVAEIAYILGGKVGAIKTRLHRVRQKLGAVLKDMEVLEGG